MLRSGKATVEETKLEPITDVDMGAGTDGEEEAVSEWESGSDWADADDGSESDSETGKSGSSSSEGSSPGSTRPSSPDPETIRQIVVRHVEKALANTKAELKEVKEESGLIRAENLELIRRERETREALEDALSSRNVRGRDRDQNGRGDRSRRERSRDGSRPNSLNVSGSGGNSRGREPRQRERGNAVVPRPRSNRGRSRSRDRSRRNAPALRGPLDELFPVNDGQAGGAGFAGFGITDAEEVDHPETEQEMRVLQERAHRAEGKGVSPVEPRRLRLEQCGQNPEKTGLNIVMKGCDGQLVLAKASLRSKTPVLTTRILEFLHTKRRGDRMRVRGRVDWRYTGAKYSMVFWINKPTWFMDA